MNLNSISIVISLFASSNLKVNKINKQECGKSNFYLKQSEHRQISLQNGQ